MTNSNIFSKQHLSPKLLFETLLYFDRNMLMSPQNVFESLLCKIRKQSTGGFSVDVQEHFKYSNLKSRFS